jgi:fibro-slime domain-containing protein
MGSGNDSDSDGLDVSPGDASTDPIVKVTETLPDGFTSAIAGGGYKRIGLLADLGNPNGDDCANILRGVVRDFELSHVDFGGPKEPADATGMVGPLGSPLGTDRKPVRAPNVHPAVAQSFADWYNNVELVNVPYVVDVWLEPQQDGTFVFDSSRFFPLDGVGTTSGNDDDGTLRNFGFTTELHTAFEYRGGETFSFSGDDDVFVYVDGKLVVDLGGVHNPRSAQVAVDELGLVPGQVYALDLFHAERNPTGSNFRIDTTLDFSECGEVLASDIIVK